MLELFVGLLTSLVLFLVICKLGARLVRFCLWGPSPPPRAYAGRPGTPYGRPQHARVYAHPVPPVPPRPPQPRVAPPPRPGSSTSHWPLLVVGLVFFCGVALWMRPSEEARVAEARAREERQYATGPRKPKAPEDSANPLWTTTVEGTGLSDKKEARQNALVEACAKFRDFLREQQPPVEWMPTPDDVQKRLQPDWHEEKALEKDDPVLGRFKVFQVSLTVQLGAEQCDKIVKLDQNHRMQQRMLWLGKIFAGVVVLLIAVAGYIRLDEWTKGYYSGWLGLVAAGLIIAAGVGVWLLFQQHGFPIP
jgi:hypothetical protein